MFTAHQISLTVKMTLAMSLKGDGEEMRIMLQKYTLFLILEVIGTIMSLNFLVNDCIYGW